jgi:hypothetical protein
MSFPVPTEERSRSDKLWRAAGGVEIDTSYAKSYVHADSQRKAQAQETFMSNENGLFRRFANRSDDRAHGLRHVPAPIRNDRAPMRRPHKHIAPFDDSRAQELFPSPSGMSYRPKVVEAQDTLWHAHGLLDQWPPAPKNVGGKKVYHVEPEEERRRHDAMDMSLWRGGVKRVPLTVPSVMGGGGGGGRSLQSLTPDPVVVGFKGFGALEPIGKQTGKALVTPQKFDPLHFKEMYGREHYGPI